MRRRPRLAHRIELDLGLARSAPASEHWRTLSQRLQDAGHALADSGAAYLDSLPSATARSLRGSKSVLAVLVPADRKEGPSDPAGDDEAAGVPCSEETI